MKKEILHKYFNQKATPEEINQILSWIDESDEHKAEYLHERKLWNIATMLSSPVEAERKSIFSNIPPQVNQLLRIAAIFILAFLSSWVVFTFYDQKKDTYTQFIEVPSGQRVHLTLADGTKVWLNANSKFRFPGKFDGKQRMVRLDGEGYFEVAKDKRHPFIVETYRYNVRVLGTTFDVYAYNKNREFETYLYEGSVKVSSRDNKAQSVILSPNQKVKIVAGKFVVQNMDEKTFAWKDGFYSFNQMRFDKFLERIEHYYGVKIIVAHPRILQYECTGKFNQQEPVENILNVVKIDNPFTYSYDRQNGIIRIK